MKKIEKEIDKLIYMIEHSTIYIEYLHLLKQVEKNKDINRLVKTIKKLQQKAVKEEYHKNNDKVKKLDKEIEIKIKALYEIPLYQEYIEKAERLNDLIIKIKKMIQDYLDHLY